MSSKNPQYLGPLRISAPTYCVEIGMNPFTWLILRGLLGWVIGATAKNQEAALNNVLVNGVEIRPQRLFEPVERGLWVLDLEPSSFPFPSTFPIN